MKIAEGKYVKVKTLQESYEDVIFLPFMNVVADHAQQEKDTNVHML